MAGTGIRACLWTSCALAAIGVGQLAYTASATETDSFSDEAVTCLAANIYHEARGESVAGQVAVAQVTLNRVADPRWPNTVCGVVYQPWQFSWTMDKTLDIRMTARISRERAYDIARSTLRGDFPDVVYGADHYHADYINTPSWATTLTVTVTIGRHIFYK